MSSFVKSKSDCSINPNAVELPNNDLTTIPKQRLSNQGYIVLQTFDIMLVGKKQIQIFEHRGIIKTKILRKNGSEFLIPIQYRHIFTDNLKSQKKQFFVIRDFYDCFVVDMKIIFDPQQIDQILSAQKLQQILQNLQQYKNFLILLGLLKSNPKTSYQIRRSQILLKKNLTKCIMNNSFKFENLQQKAQNNSQQNKNILQVKSIQQIPQSQINQNGLAKKGGYFLIQKKQCEVTKMDGSVIKKILVLKKLRSSKSKQEKYLDKLTTQLNFVRQIKSNKYIVQYYLQQLSKEYFYMDCVDSNLQQIIHSDYEAFTIKQIFSIIKQLFEAINILHQSGIVHRDLKPANILISGQNGQKKLKIIDFGQSALIGVTLEKNPKLGCTIPYSPIQCMIDTEDGYNNSAIDLWSVIMIMYELIFKKLPLYYSRGTQQQIVSVWKEEDSFSTILSFRPKKGLRKLQEYICYLTEHALKIQQKQRLKLQVLYQYIDNLQIFYNQIISKFRKNQ